MKHLYLKSLLIALLAMATIPTFAYDCEVDGIYYNISYWHGYGEATVTSSPNREYKGNINIPSSIEYDGIIYSVRRIDTSAFRYCSSLISIGIPNSVWSIDSNAFTGCSSLVSINIPDGVRYIMNGTFADCSSLTSVNIPNSVEYIEDYAFHNCYSLTSVTIPNSVKSIGESAFERCSGLTSVTIPNSVKSIGESAFSGCSDLTSVTIGNSVTSIGEAAFGDCSDLTSVTIGNSVTSIGDYAFSGCSSLTLVYSYITEPFVIDAFERNDSIGFITATIYVPKGCVELYRATEGWSSFENILEMDDEMTIEGQPNASAVAISRFDLRGRRLWNRQKGLNIVKMSDGTVRKVILTK